MHRFLLRSPWLLFSLLPLCAVSASDVPAAVPPPLEDFFARDAFSDVRISPDGRHLAASVPLESGSGLLMLETASLAKVGHFFAGPRTEVAQFWWAGNQRLLIAAAERAAGMDVPGMTGELHAVDVDGGRPITLAGQRAGDGRVGTRIPGRQNERVLVYPVDLLPDAPDQALVQVLPPGGRSDVFASIERLDVRSGRRTRLGVSPVQRASFATDPQGSLRFAAGFRVNNESLLYHREDDRAEWQLLNDESESGLRMGVLGFAADGRSAYLQVSRPDGPDAVERFDPASGSRTEVFRHARRDPAGPVLSLDGRYVIGVLIRAPEPEMHFLEAEHPEVHLRRSLAAAFPGQEVRIASASLDGRLAVLFVSSDRNPGDYYLFDRETRDARHIGSRIARLDPRQMGRMQAISLQARDGLQLDGLLTLPPGSKGRQLPMVVHPHGGPFGVEDRWGFNPQVQLLATRGYAVLQVNFRGSGGFGEAFLRAGYRQWGQAMQDDLTDATRWAIAEGIADPARICIYGASYGGYASLMAVAKEPALYACAVGNVGVYDLELMHRRGDIPYRFSGRHFLRDALGSEGLREHSPNHLAERIRVPVLLSAGAEDRRAPMAHTERMESALRQAGGQVEALYFKGEGHGFYSPDNELQFQRHLLAFLDRHIGSTVAAAEPGRAD